jgi:rhodanese-related sulfurtransferase
MIWIPVALLVVVAGWYWFEGRWDRRLFKTAAGRTCLNLRPREAKSFLETHPETQILDVRSEAEFSRGALAGATNIPLSNRTFAQKLDSLDRERPVLVYCAGGYRSRKAVETLKAGGFSTIRHLHRGYYSWRLAGLHGKH